MSSHNLRKRHLCDKKVQYGLILRAAIYMMAGMLFVILPLTFLRTVFTPSVNFFTHFADLFSLHWPILAMAVLMTPFAFRDLLRFSNRFVGPIYRLRQEFKAFEATGKMRKFKFREKDFWKDLAISVNGMSARIQELETQLAEAKGEKREAEETETVSV